MLNKKREKTVSHENRFCVEGVCPSQFVIFPDQTGTATSSPDIKTPSPNIINVMLWMKRNAYADSTIKATAKRLKHLQKHCDLTQPEEVKAFIANKDCSNAFKECLIETYDFMMRSIGIEWDKPFYERYDKLRPLCSLFGFKDNDICKELENNNQIYDWMMNNAKPLFGVCVLNKFSWLNVMRQQGALKRFRDDNAETKAFIAPLLDNIRTISQIRYSHVSFRHNDWFSIYTRDQGWQEGEF